MKTQFTDALLTQKNLQEFLGRPFKIFHPTALLSRAPRFAAGLFTKVGGDVVAFGVEEGAYRFLAACYMILFAHCIPPFAAVLNVLCGRITPHN
jgi:hypothetical protein